MSEECQNMEPVKKGFGYFERLMADDEWQEYLLSIARKNAEKKKARIAEVAKNRRSCPSYKAQKAMLARLRHMLTASRKRRTEIVFDFLPYTATQLRAHFEALFQPWMNWDNYGEWQIDHKKPCSLFDHTNPNHIKECWALENLQPLSVADNMKKGSKYEPS